MSLTAAAEACLATRKLANEGPVLPVTLYRLLNDGGCKFVKDSLVAIGALEEALKASKDFKKTPVGAWGLRSWFP